MTIEHGTYDADGVAVDVLSQLAVQALQMRVPRVRRRLERSEPPWKGLHKVRAFCERVLHHVQALAREDVAHEVLVYAIPSARQRPGSNSDAFLPHENAWDKPVIVLCRGVQPLDDVLQRLNCAGHVGRSTPRQDQ